VEYIIAQVSNDMILKSAMPPQTLKDTRTELTGKSAHDLQDSIGIVRESRKYVRMKAAQIKVAPENG
jgi:hypothetical protein